MFLVRRLVRWLLVEFDKHATGLHVSDVTDRIPHTIAIAVDDTCTASVVPPSTEKCIGSSAVNTAEDIVVSVYGTELHSTGTPVHVLCIHERFREDIVVSVYGTELHSTGTPVRVLRIHERFKEDIVVSVYGTELHSIGTPVRVLHIHQSIVCLRIGPKLITASALDSILSSSKVKVKESIVCVSAVPVHRQLILTNLITDGERRVLGPVPRTVTTLDLQIPT